MKVVWYKHQMRNTYVHRLAVSGSGRLTRFNIKRGATLAFNLLLRVGMLADYHRPFWRIAWQALKHGQIESLLSIGFISHHLIEFSREALRGDQNASFYSARARETYERRNLCQMARSANPGRSYCMHVILVPFGSVGYRDSAPGATATMRLPAHQLPCVYRLPLNRYPSRLMSSVMPQAILPIGDDLGAGGPLTPSQ